MDTISPFWIYEGEIPPRVCDEIVKGVDEENYTTGGIIDSKDNDTVKTIDVDIRNVGVQFTYSPWINHLMRGFLLSANENNFLYDLSENDKESCQVSRYSGTKNKPQYYNIHKDWVDIRNSQAHTRKLSLSCQLTNPNDYEGGDLILYLEHAGTSEIVEYTVSKKQGTVIVFDSRIRHKVTPVTSGTRHSVVKWYHGDKPLR
tara:strand:- start:335 stop:940 length:606 start_codon:yes stop_codon:yes gene_type:complete